MESDNELIGFCRSIYPKVLGALTLYCGNREIAQELAQETMARVCRDWRRIRRRGMPEAWTYRVAINLANSHFRRMSAERRARERLETTESEQFESNSATVMSIRQAVAKLPHRQRTALVLRYFLDLPVQQVAALMQCSEGNVKALTSKAIESLRNSSSISGLTEGALNVI